MNNNTGLKSVPIPRLTHPLITPGHLERLLIIYLRQSSPGQVQANWGSTEVQRNQIQLAKAYGWTDERIIVISEDLGKSGATTKGRTGWDNMLDLIASGRVAAVMVINVSRLAREVGDFEELRVLAKRNGVILILDGRPANPADPNDTAMLQVSAVFAQLDNHTRTNYLRATKRQKAIEGKIVSQLPIGWLTTADGSIAFDPEDKPTIDLVYSTFRQVGTLRGTVAVLNRRGVELPSRYRGEKRMNPATVEAVRRFITNPAYAGVYIFGKSDNRPEYGVDQDGKARRRRLPESEWIRHENRIPAYISPAEQAEFLRRLKANGFNARNRPREGCGLTQGLLVCNRCESSLTVGYPNRGAYRYQCTRRASQYAEKTCFSICGDEIDGVIVNLFLQRIDGPLDEILESALAAARAAQDTEGNRDETLRKQLEYVNEVAWSRYRRADERNDLVRARLEREANDAAKALAEFSERMAAKARRPSLDGLECEVKRLAESVSGVTGLWTHPGVKDRERKEMFRCLIERIVIDRTDTAIEATVHWFDDTTTPITLLHLGGMREYVRELHTEGLTAKQIRDRLAAGHPVTGQKWEYTKVHIYQILRHLGVAPNSRRTAMAGIRSQMLALYEQGLGIREIAEQLNRAGHRTSRDRAWTQTAVYHWLNKHDRRSQLEAQHHALLLDAKRRGLSNAEAAEEFNRRGIVRMGGGPWTSEVVRQRRKHLNVRAKLRGRS